MAMSEYRKMQIEQRALDRQLEAIADRKKQRIKKRRRLGTKIYKTLPEVFRYLGDRSKPKRWH